MVDASGHFDEEQWLRPTLELEDRRHGPALADHVAEGLCTTDMVRYLGLRRNNLGDDGIRVICEGLKANRSVEILDLSENSIRDEGAIAIAEVLRTSTTLQSIILEKNKIRKAGADALAAAMRVNKRLRKISLSDNRIRDGGATSFAEAMRDNKTMQHLNLSRNEINVAGGRACAAALETNEVLQALNLANNLIGEAVVDFGIALTKNTTLLELDLENNMINSDHALEFGHSLLQISLRTINLSNNQIGDSGLKPILESFKERSSLRYLDLSYTGITAKSMDEVAHLLRLCPQLETLQVDGNNLGCEGVELLAATIKENQSLASLNLDRCKLDSTAVIALALSLHNNPLFNSLTVSGNSIGDEGCRSLCYALKRMTLLKTLDFSNNKLTNAILQELASIFVNNQTLNFVQLEGNPVASDLVNGVLSRRVAFQILQDMDDSSSVLAEPTPLANFKRTALATGRVSQLSTTSSNYDSVDMFMSTSGTPTPSKSALVQMAMQTDQSGFQSTMSPSVSMEGEEHEWKKSTYPHLIPPKYSLESPYYPGFGRGRFSNGTLVTTIGEHLPYTIYNSQGPTPLVKWNDQISTADTLFRTPLRRVRKANPYSERQLEVNIGGLLVTEKQLRDAFNELDVDGTGWLSKTEFEQLYRTFENFGVPMNEKQIKSIVNRYKMWDDNKLNFDEFCLMMLTVAGR